VEDYHEIKKRSETGEPSRTIKKEMFILASVFALLIPAWQIASLCAAEAVGAIPGGQMGHLTSPG
jgi:hypothetical protein